MVQQNTLELLFADAGLGSTAAIAREAFEKFYYDGCVVYVNGPGSKENELVGFRGSNVTFEARFSNGTMSFCCFTQEAYERTIELCRRYCTELGEDVTDPQVWCEDDKNDGNNPVVYFGTL